jgi:hypothetical protein
LNETDFFIKLSPFIFINISFQLGIAKKYVNAWSQENTVANSPTEPIVPLPGIPASGGFGQPNIFMPVAAPIGGDSGPTSFLSSSADQSNSNEVKIVKY